jgi:tetratricopeptide (TPR) repeat protein
MQGRLDEAIVAHQASIRLEPAAPEPHYNLARAYEKKGQLADARRAFERAAELARPRDKPELFLGIGDFLARHGEMAEAERWFERAAETWPRFVNGHLYLGYVYWKRGRLAEARASFERALRLDPTSPKGHEGLGLVLRSQGKEVEARRQFELAAEHARLGAGVRPQGTLDAVASPDSDQP